MTPNVKALPNGKEHVSFSELSTWKTCAWKHKLIYIDKISVFKGSIFTVFGTIIHSASENYFKTRVMDVDDALNKLKESWEKNQYPRDDWEDYIEKDLEFWINSLRAILTDIPDFIEQNFPEWEFVDAEAYLYEFMPESELNFKGFVDLIIKFKNKQGKVIYWILDWKTAPARGWHRDKKQDEKVLHQLVLYKKFWAEKNGIPIKDVRCGFVLLKRGVFKKGKVCSLLTVSAGPKTIAKAEKSLKNMIESVRKKMHIKNKYGCRFCEFYDTEHCKGSKLLF